MRVWLFVALVACSPDHGSPWKPYSGDNTPRDGGTLRISIKDQIATLDPTAGNDEVSLYAIHSMFDTLVDYEVGGTGLVARLAERWDISSDQRTFTFHLRGGLRYADGAPIVAADIKFALERALRTKDSPARPYLRDVEGAGTVVDDHTECPGITAPNDRELVIHLTKPNAAFLYVMTMVFSAPQRRDYTTKLGDQLRKYPLASGPYQLAYWSEGERIEMVRNPYYYDHSRGHIERIVIFENIQRDIQFLMFDRGELDAAEKLSPPDYFWITNEPAWHDFIHARALLNTFGSRMNVTKKPFDDVRVRRALNYALDKSHTKKLLSGGSVPAHGILPPGIPGYDDTLAPYPHDPAKARALLAEAGYPHGFSVDYVTTSGDEETSTLATSLKADLADVGVDVRIQLMTFEVVNNVTNEPDGPPFSIGAWAGDYPDPSAFFDPIFHSITDRSSNNNTFYKNPALDKLLDDARAELDPDKRAAMYKRAERIVYDDAPWIWDYHKLMTEVTQPYVRDYEPHPVWIRDYTSAWLDVGPDGEPVKR